MSVQEYYELLNVLERIQTPDAFGNNTTYVIKKNIMGAIGVVNKNEYMIADAQEEKADYIITIDMTDILEYDTIIKREKTGQYIRIVSDINDGKPPSISSFDWWQIEGQKFIMPKEEEPK